MSGRTHLVWSDGHNKPGSDQRLNDWLGKLILDLRPDVVVNNGDHWDMESLCSYDRGTRAFQGRSYVGDISAGVEANDRIFSPIRKAKRKMPHRVYTVGNHEWRIEKALNLSPELDGAIGWNDLSLGDYYNDVVPYEGSTPGVIELDGIYYAHYLVSGVLGRPIGGVHQASSLIAQQGASCTVGHSHILDFSRRVGVDGRTRLGLVTGTFNAASPSFAGMSGRLWWRGVVICRNVENGNYDPEFVSLERLEQEYGEPRLL
jgi:hypothetical protein